MIKKLSKGAQEKRKKELQQLYYDKGIVRCELKMPPTEHNPQRCLFDWTLAFAHREKRVYYKSCPEKLWTFEETVLACTVCHSRIESDRLLTLQVFKKLRNN